jgi:SAM-dependent methyltransferase
MDIGDKKHWEGIYESKSDAELSWHQDALSLSFGLICKFAQAGNSVIDIGGGSSSLIGALVQEGFRRCAVLDISETALVRAKNRLLPPLQEQIAWLSLDILSAPNLPTFDVWHDRAVFHFLEPDQRAAYIALARRTVCPGGHIVVGVFALDGPDRCSGLPVYRYDASTLETLFEDTFVLRAQVQQVHRTPWGAHQSFLYVVLERLTRIEHSRR